MSLKFWVERRCSKINWWSSKIHSCSRYHLYKHPNKLMLFHLLLFYNHVYRMGSWDHIHSSQKNLNSLNSSLTVWKNPAPNKIEKTLPPWQGTCCYSCCCWQGMPSLMSPSIESRPRKISTRWTYILYLRVFQHTFGTHLFRNLYQWVFSRISFHSWLLQKSGCAWYRGCSVTFLECWLVGFLCRESLQIARGNTNPRIPRISGSRVSGRRLWEFWAVVFSIKKNITTWNPKANHL